MSAFADAAASVRSGADAFATAAELVDEMTLDERLGCLDGELPFWPGLADMMTGGYHRRPWPAARVERLGVPGLDFSDGPRGCVISAATTFPVSMARGASFDPDLERRIGRAIGAELRASGATYTGAVCCNLLRHPAWGRAQETYGEDPHHVGELAAAFTEGLQEHVMACVKHFALNSMENARFRVDVTADERALHEVYLPHFRRVVDAGVASVMSAYNSVNGAWCGDNSTLLTEILRDEWAFAGFVITDFLLGLRDPIVSIEAGCNIEMPFRQQRAPVVAQAVADGRLSTSTVDRRVTEIVATFLRFAYVFEQPPPTTVIACDEHRALARKASVSSMVLLTNDGVLPLAPSTRKIAVLGRLAARASLGDAGSSNVAHTPDPVAPLDGIRAAFADAEVVHADDDTSIVDGADAVVVVVGYTRLDEGEYLGAGLNNLLGELAPPIDDPELGTDDERIIRAFASADDGGAGDGPGTPAGGATGGDRASLRLNDADEALIAAACAAHDRVVVAVVAGSAVVMPWLDAPAAVIMQWYAGSEGGHALADVLTGTEPSGRLPFAIPVSSDDLVTFDRDATEATYGLLHGQWWLDANDTTPQLPFGHGLSYASFELDDLTVDADARSASATVINTADRSGSTVVFASASVPGSAYERPPQRLVGFGKVTLDRDTHHTIEIALDLDQLRVRENGRWIVEDAAIEISLGFDAGDRRAAGIIHPT